MMSFFLIGGLFLGWAFGRNNLSNVFGTAIGTRMVSLKMGATLTGLFVLLGALISGHATTASVMQLGHVSTIIEAFAVSVCIGFVMFCAGRFGIPVSIVQASVGCLIGFNVYMQTSTDWDLVIDMVQAWMISPIVAFMCSVFLFVCIRKILYKVKVPLLYRDVWVRFFLILVGIFSAYTLGANNISSLVGPYQEGGVYAGWLLVILICLAVAIGAQMADKRVIETVSSGLFPLSPVEALVVILSGAVTLLFFSSTLLASALEHVGIPTLLVPIPTSCVLIGSILGISFVKGGRGIHMLTLTKMVASWFLVPVFSGLICFTFMGILNIWGWF